MSRSKATMSIKTLDALERAMRAFHDSTQWASERADWTDGRPDKEHPSFYAAIETAHDEDMAVAYARGVADERNGRPYPRPPPRSPMSAEAIARLHIEVAAWDAAKASQQPNPDPVLESLRSESFLSPIVRAHVSDLRALLDAHAKLEAAHTEALDALEKLRAAQKHVLEVTCAGDDEYMAAVDGAEAVLAKAGRR